jgi:hypothetical protein
MLFVQVAADFELDILALAERAEEEEQGLEEKRRVEEAVQDVMVTDEDVNYPLVPFPLVAYPCSFCGKALPSKKQLARHVVGMHKDPTSID